jgi:hypothetical protein
MTTWEFVAEWLTTLVLATLAWASGIADPALPISADGNSNSQNSIGAPPGFTLAWAQDDTPPIEQVEEGTSGDVETLDEGAPPVASETESLDAEPAAVAPVEDIELLDQGSPPAAGAMTSPPATAPALAPAAVAVAPAGGSGTYVDPAFEPAPQLPADFGTGNVHVSAGSEGFPVGLEPCHVGAVTGRAYVGINCGDDVSFVGHAPTFADFPFVPEEEFPFGDEELVVSAAQGDRSDEVGVFVSAAGGNRGARDDRGAPVIETSGRASVEYAQEERGRDPRVRVTDNSAKRAKQETRDTKADKKGDERSSANGKDTKDNGKDKKSKKKSKSEKNKKSNKKQKQKQKSHGNEKSGDRDKRKSSQKR